METLIMVVAYKAFDDSICPKGYSVIKVGNSISDRDAIDKGWLVDSTGDNIAQENPYYCELTAQYWAWKNRAPEIQYIGLSHYRRYFFDYRGNAGASRMAL